jgi:hypothetical protein
MGGEALDVGSTVCGKAAENEENAMRAVMK